MSAEEISPVTHPHAAKSALHVLPDKDPRPEHTKAGLLDAMEEYLSAEEALGKSLKARGERYDECATRSDALSKGSGGNFAV